MRFSLGDFVVVRASNSHSSERIPKYILGKKGRILHRYGRVKNSLDHREIYSPLYSVEFKTKDVFNNNSKEVLTVDVHEDSLIPFLRKNEKNSRRKGE